MAGTLVVTRVPRVNPNNAQPIERIVIDWTSDASGNADVSISNLYGWLVRLVTDPHATAPTDDYDITLVDEDSIDALGGAGANRDTANTEQVAPVLSGAANAVFLCGTYTFTVANAGNAKLGKAVLYIVPNM